METHDNPQLKIQGLPLLLLTFIGNRHMCDKMIHRQLDTKNNKNNKTFVKR